MTESEMKAKAFNEQLRFMKELDFTIGGYFGGYADYVYDFRNGNVIFSTSHSFIRDPSNKPYELFEKNQDTLISELQEIELGKWEKNYFNQGVCDGTQWELLIEYEDGNKTEFSGSNMYPENFQKLLDALGLSRMVHGEWEKNKRSK